jgi:hypothetical protein
MKSVLASVCGLVSVVGGVFGEVATECRLRVLAVGDPPPFVQEVRDGARYEVAPPEGAVPPRELRAAAAGEEGPVELGGLRLRLGSVTPPMVFTRPEDGRVTLERESGGVWLGLRLPEEPAGLAVLWSKGRDWNEAQALVLPDGPSVRREGVTHFTNVTAVPMALVVGGERIRLEPGRTWSKGAAPEGGVHSVEVLYPDSEGGLRRCFSAGFEFQRGAFRRVFLYATDHAEARLPVAVTVVEEPVGLPCG